MRKTWHVTPEERETETNVSDSTKDIAQREGPDIEWIRYNNSFLKVIWKDIGE